MHNALHDAPAMSHLKHTHALQQHQTQRSQLSRRASLPRGRHVTMALRIAPPVPLVWLGWLCTASLALYAPHIISCEHEHREHPPLHQALTHSYAVVPEETSSPHTSTQVLGYDVFLHQPVDRTHSTGKNLKASQITLHELKPQPCTLYPAGLH
jgi:hypothetical protein